MKNFKIDKLNFAGPSGPIPASLISTQQSTNETAVVLPGAGYPCTMPLLYYSIDALILKGYQVLAINKVYADDSKWLQYKTIESALKYVEDDTLDLFTQISSQFSNQVKVLLGRSLGTFQMARVLELRIVGPRQVVWQTPSLHDKWPVIKSCGVLGFGIIGTLDQRYEAAINHLPQESIIIEGADHAMESPGNVIQSIKNVEKVIKATSDWLMKSQA
jgi:hypothetical protein